MTDPILALMGYQRDEHEAWRVVVDELANAGVADIERGGVNERLHDAIVAWGEELAQLRLHDPEPKHAENALRERREAAYRWRPLP